MLEISLIEVLRKIQLAWEMDARSLSLIAHTPQETLEKYLMMSADEVAELPSVPSGLANAVALVGVFQKINTLVPDPVKQNEWLIEPNSIFENQKPIEVLAMSPNHVGWVAYTLESSITNALSTSV